MNKNIISFKKKTLVILAHIDDEFALSPIIKKITKINSDNIKILFCAERLNDSLRIRNKRRSESLSSLSLLGCKVSNIYYLNNYFLIDDLTLYKSFSDIYSYLKEFKKSFDFKQIFTLNFEGGHPDHDSLALLIDKFSTNYSINKFFFPAYNNRKSFGIPLSLFRPLRSQEFFFSSIDFNFFCWKESILIAFIYKTEWKAFIKLLPFILYNYFFLHRVYFTNSIKLDSVIWSKSFSSRIYKVNYKKIQHFLYKI